MMSQGYLFVEFSDLKMEKKYRWDLEEENLGGGMIFQDHYHMLKIKKIWGFCKS
jgi:hypothetical protein